MEKNTKENNPYKIKPLKDILLFLLCLVIILCPTISIILLRKSDGNKYVTISYKGIDLIDIDSTTKTTKYDFPSNGERIVTIYKNQSSLYLEDTTFGFDGDYFSITLYSDRSIQIKKEDITCKDHVCSSYGKIKDPYTPIVCLPNQIQVMIHADSLPEYDA